MQGPAAEMCHTLAPNLREIWLALWTTIFDNSSAFSIGMLQAGPLTLIDANTRSLSSRMGAPMHRSPG